MNQSDNFYYFNILSSRKYYYYRRPIKDLLETYMYLIGDPSETKMPDRRPIGDQHAWSETCWRLTCLIRDPLETILPDQRPVGDQIAWSETHLRATCLLIFIGDHGEIWVSDRACRSPIKKDLRQGKLVSNQAFWSPMGLQWCMLVSYGSPMSLG